MNDSVSPERRPRLVRFLGILLVAIGIGYGLYQYSIIKSWASASAEVLRVDSFRTADADDGYSTTYEPTLKYSDGSGKPIVTKPGYRSSHFDFEVGARVPIVYNPDRPSEFRVLTFMSFWALPILSFGFGALIILIVRGSKG